MDYNEEKAHEIIEDVMGEGASNCCGARVYSPSGDWAICMDCKEYCSVVTTCTQPGCDGSVEEGKCELKTCPSNRSFNADQQAIINKNEAACAAAGCDDNGHKCNK